ncbi:helix-turn-helix domain-containing protein [Flavobacterium sp. MAHUQ-51]|uniref:helix-turn-helix domain-containing protein n=1 Tax=Flavobacterium sp. GCM10022190 TaxID=3252639 RepID=UPI00361E4FA0
MKLTSTILGQQQAFICIETNDYYDANSSSVEEKIIVRNGEDDEIRVNNQRADGILILDSQMYFTDKKTILTEISGESILMNFFGSSNFETHVDQLERDFFSIENTHNILYGYNLKVTTKVPALEELHCLTIVLSPEFYFKLIHEDWSLHDTFSKNIGQKRTEYLMPEYLPFNSAMQWVIHEIKNCKFEGQIRKMYLETKIKELLLFQLDSLLPKSTKREGIHDEELNKLLKAKLILEENFTNAPSLQELSRLIALNEFKLKKGFKACFKTTIKSYVTQLRMEYAKILFKNENSNVGEIAYKCGYKDVSHFSATFKSFYGFSPASFRKINIGAKIYLLSMEFFEMIYIDILSLDYILI